ncbi:hypothetical protein LCGC14_1559590, partial [marine sediment metagenome]
QERLSKQEAFNRIFRSEDFQRYVVPLLQESTTSDFWPDPSKYTAIEFLKVYNESYYETRVYKAISNISINSGAPRNSMIVSPLGEVW